MPPFLRVILGNYRKRLQGKKVLATTATVSQSIIVILPERSGLVAYVFLINRKSVFRAILIDSPHVWRIITVLRDFTPCTETPIYTRAKIKPSRNRSVPLRSDISHTNPSRQSTCPAHHFLNRALFAARLSIIMLGSRSSPLLWFAFQ